MTFPRKWIILALKDDKIHIYETMFDGKIPVVTMVNGHESSNISGRKQLLQFANI